MSLSEKFYASEFQGEVYVVEDGYQFPDFVFLANN